MQSRDPERYRPDLETALLPSEVEHLREQVLRGMTTREADQVLADARRRMAWLPARRN